MPTAPLHLIKLAVGATDIAHLRQFQAERMAADPPLRHRTRNMPRRAAEITDGGSIYWCIRGALVVRQRIAAITPDTWDDGSACAALILDPALAPVFARPMKPFQGWRYLPDADAPPDIGATPGHAGAADALPPTLVHALRELALL